MSSDQGSLAARDLATGARRDSGSSLAGSAGSPSGSARLEPANDDGAASAFADVLAVLQRSGSVQTIWTEASAHGQGRALESQAPGDADPGPVSAPVSASLHHDSDLGPWPDMDGQVQRTPIPAARSNPARAPGILTISDSTISDLRQHTAPDHDYAQDGGDEDDLESRMVEILRAAAHRHGIEV